MPLVEGASSLRGRVQADTGKGSETHEGQSQMKNRGAENQTDPSSNPSSMLVWSMKLVHPPPLRTLVSSL